MAILTHRRVPAPVMARIEDGRCAKAMEAIYTAYPTKTLNDASEPVVKAL